MKMVRGPASIDRVRGGLKELIDQFEDREAVLREGFREAMD